MTARVLLAVFAIMFGAQCADAGVIVSPQVIAGQPSDAALLSVLTAMAASAEADDAEVPPCGAIHGSPGGMAGVSLGPTLVAGAHACACSGWDLSPPVSAIWRITLVNAILPPSPVLSGLLKPS